jgi:hypothetical protein
VRLVEATSWKQINNPDQWPEDLRWALAAYRERTDKLPGMFYNATSPRFISVHRQEFLFWSTGYPGGWDHYARPHLDLLVGPERARA